MRTGHSFDRRGRPRGQSARGAGPIPVGIQSREEASMGRLRGKVAIVTGAASQAEGIGNGAATAILFAREGAKVVLVNRSTERAEALAEHIYSEGGEAASFAADVTQPNATQAMAAFAVE